MAAPNMGIGHASMQVSYSFLSISPVLSGESLLIHCRQHSYVSISTNIHCRQHSNVSLSTNITSTALLGEKLN